MFKYIALLAMVSLASAETVEHEEYGLMGDTLYTYRQKIALRKAYKFFKYADSNHTGLMTWSEYWSAVVRILHAKGYSYATINRYKYLYVRYFKMMDASHSGLVTWYEMKRFILKYVH